jgi:hypothetical protein
MPHPRPRVLPLACLAVVLLAWPVAARQVRAVATACSRVWAGHEPEIERLLATAPVERLEAVPIGVTKPQRGYFPTGSLAQRFAWKALPPMRRGGYMESYKAEIAAYKLDRLLELGMVPPVAERTVEGKVGAAVLWIEQTTPWNKDKPAQGPEPGWSKQISRMKLFDRLIANIDRNAGNLLYDADWHLFLIDHSRAFTTRTSLDNIATLNLVDRPLWTRIEALTAADLEHALGPWLSAGERAALLARRDGIRREIDELVKRRGAARVFLD